MAKRYRRKSVDRAKFREYQRVAEHFLEAAKLAMEGDYWTAAGVLIVHSAIAYSDTVAIKMSGQKSASESHEDAIVLLKSLIADGDQKTKAMSQLSRIIEEKTRVSYMGEMYTPAQTRELWKRLGRFRAWVEGILAS
jgi:hypothetical protein